MKRDFVIIGSGASGMSAALLLARHGRSVALVEKAPVLAPLLSGFTCGDVHFDTGFHYSGGLGRGGLLDMFLRYLGLNDVEYIPYDEDGFDLLRLTDAGLDFIMPYGRERVRDALCTAFPCECRAVDNFLSTIDRAVSSSFFLNPDLPFDFSISQTPSCKVTLQEYLDSITTNSLLKALLSVHTLLHGTPPAEVDLLHHARIFGPYLHSVHGIVGGGQALVTSFKAALQRQGVDLLIGCGVDAILADSTGVRGVRLEDEQTIKTEGCVFTAHPRLLLGMVPDGVFRPAFRKRIQGLDESPSIMLLFGAARECPDSLRRRNIFDIPCHDIAGNFLPGLPPDQRTLYVTCGQTPSRVGKYGIVAIMADFVAEERDCVNKEAYEGHKNKLLKIMRDRLIDLSPDLSGVATVDGATPGTLRHWANNPFGSMYGIRHSIAQYSPLPVTKVPGLYMAGQGVIAPGLLGAVISALVLGEIIMGRDSVRGPLRKYS